MLKFWMVDPGVVLQKLAVETSDAKPAYLEPPESFYRAVLRKPHPGDILLDSPLLFVSDGCYRV